MRMFYEGQKVELLIGADGELYCVESAEAEMGIAPTQTLTIESIDRKAATFTFKANAESKSVTNSTRFVFPHMRWLDTGVI